MIKSSQYINDQRREYSLYVMQSRAICAGTDGLKAGGRRALWTARSGAKMKTATLAGATMPIHPHAECTGAINTLAAPYGNNIPLFKGDGAFGTMLHPTSYGAARYTSISVSKL
jgi:DNA gyrase/topoisomerase IV subunit A